MATTQLKFFGSNARQITPAVVNMFQNNNNVDRLEFTMENYNQDNVDLSTLDPYAICHGKEFVDCLDEVKLTSEVLEDGSLHIYWDLTVMTLTASQTVTYQIVFKNDEGQVWTSNKAILFANESLTADEEIVAKYPTILKQIESRIYDISEEASGEVAEEFRGDITNVIQYINNMAGNFDASVVYIAYGETLPVEYRVANRLYYQYTNGEHTKGRFEDYLGTILMSESSGGGGGGSSLPMFAYIWSDVLYNDASYLRADTFSWHYYSIYKTAYEKLLGEYNNVNCVEKTENGVTYKLTPNGFKIANADQHDNVRLAYEEIGSAWFYLIDTENQRFKLPRENAEVVTRYPRNGSVTVSDLNIYGNGMTLGVTDGVEYGGLYQVNTSNVKDARFATDAYGQNVGFEGAPLTMPNGSVGVTTDPTKSGITGDGTGVANLPTPLTERVNTDVKKYLYFYVGEYERPATEVNIGILTELANGTDISVIVEEINVAKDTAIAEVQATSVLAELQAQIDSLKAEINTMLGRMDFANSEEFEITQLDTYTCPSDGYIQVSYATNNYDDRYMRINGSNFCSLQAICDGMVGMFPVSSGDILSSTGGDVQGTFIPQKGV